MRRSLILFLLLVVTRVGASADAFPETDRLSTLTQGWPSFEQRILERYDQLDALKGWVNGLSQEGFCALKDFVTCGPRGMVRSDRLLEVHGEALSSQEVLLAREHCAQMFYPYLFFPILKEGNTPFLKSAARIFVRLQNCDLFDQKFYPSVPRDAGRERGALTLARLKEQSPETLTMLDEGGVSTYQLFAVLFCAPAFDPATLPPLLTFLREVRSAYGDETNQSMETSQGVIEAYLRTPMPLIKAVMGWNLGSENRFTLLLHGGGLSMRRAQFVSTLLTHDKGRDALNMLYHMDKSPLDDAQLDALEALPQEARRLHFVVSGTLLGDDDVGVVARLFEGCTLDEERNLEYVLRGFSPSVDVLRALLSYELSPTGRASGLDRPWDGAACLFEKILMHFKEEARANVVGLYSALISGCTFDEASRVARHFPIACTEEGGVVLPFAEGVRSCDFSPAVRPEILSEKPPLESLPTLKKMFEGMALSDVKKSLTTFREFACSPHLLQGVQEAQFDKNHVPLVLQNARWLEARGWSSPTHFEALKWMLTLDICADDVFGLIRKSCTSAQDFESLRRHASTPEELYDMIDKEIS